MLAIITQIHWHFAFFAPTVTVVDQGRTIGVSATIGSKDQKHCLYLYDDELNLKKSVVLNNIKFTNAHGISPDGKYLVGVGDKPQFEIVSLTSDEPPIVVPFAEEYKSTHWDITYTHNPTHLRLVGDPPYSILVATDFDVWLIDRSGAIEDKISWKTSTNVRVFSKHLAAYDNFYGTTLECFSIDQKFTRVHKEVIPGSNSQTLRRFPEITSTGLIALQRQNDVRIINTNEPDPSKRETYISWPSAAGYLEGLSDSGKTLRFRDYHDERVLMSTVSSTVLARSSIVESDWYFNYATFLDDNKLLFTQAKRIDEAKMLGVWDWSKGTLKERELEHYPRYFRWCVNLLLLASVAVWATLFLRYAIKHSRAPFGVCLILSLFGLLLFWLQTQPFFTYWLGGIDVPGITQRVPIWQLTLSLLGVWTFRYMSVTAAACVLFCVARYAGSWIGFAIFEFATLSSMLIAFVLLMSIYQHLVGIKQPGHKRLSIADIMTLTLTVAILTWWFKNADPSGIADFMTLGTSASLGTAFGIVHCASTLIALALSKRFSRVNLWLFVPVVLLYGLIFYHFTRTYFIVVDFAFWPGFALLCLLEFIVIWPILTFVDRYLEQPYLAKQHLELEVAPLSQATATLT